MTGSPDKDFYRDFGQLEAKVEALTQAQTELAKKVETLTEVITAAKGGWKVIFFIAGAAATIGAGLTKIIPLFNK